MKSVLGKFWLACAGAVVLLAVLLSLVRVLLPYADAWREEVEERLGAALGQEVSIGRLAAEWRGLAPQLELEDLRVGSVDGGARFGRAHLEVDVPRSLLNRTLYIRKLTVSGLHLTVVRQADGRIAVAGLGDASRSPESGRLALPAQGRLLAEDAEIRLIDLAVPGEPSDLLFTDVDFELWSAVGRHQVDGELTPPAGLGARLRFALDLHAPAQRPWRAQLYVDGVGLPLREWFADRLPGVRTEGLANASVWMDWRDGALQRVDGVFTVRGFALARVPASAPESASDRTSAADDVVSEAATASAMQAAYSVEAASGVFAWRGFDGGWRLDAGDLVLDHGAGPAPPRRFALGTGQRGLEPGALVARVDALPVEEALRLLAFGGAPDSLAGVVEGVRPRGMLRDIAFTLQPAVPAGPDVGKADTPPEAPDEALAGQPAADPQQPVSPRFRLQANFDAVGGEPWRGIPGFSGVAGKVHLDEGGGTLDLEAAPGELAFDGLFRAPLPVQRLQAALAWERHGEGWRLRLPAASLANEDLTLDAWGRIDLRHGDSPFVALYARYEAATVARMQRYLPVGIMPAGTVRWLDRAIEGGSVPRGELILHGALRDFPYDRGEGLFRVDFDVRGGLLEYSELWPRIEDIDARLVFTGRRMEIAAARGRTLRAAIGPTRVAIADMRGKPAVLTVDGSARGPVADGLAFLRDTPLASRFGPYVEEVVADGNHLVDLSLKLPLGQAAEVSGTVNFEDSALRLGTDGIEIKHIKGPLGFSNDGLHADGLAVNLLSLPATLSVNTGGEGESRHTRVEARGVIGAADAARLAHLPPRWLAGSSSWRARLAVPGVEEIRSDGMMLRVESALEGMAITLPAPLAKPADSAMPLLVSMPLPRSPVRPVTVALGSRAAGDGLSIALGFDDAHALERGELRFGGGEAALPGERGLRIAGRVSAFSLGEWQRVLARGEEADAQGAMPLPVSAVDIEVDRVDAFGRGFDEVEVSARPNQTAWHADVRSRQMAGRVEIPLSSGPPWRADLEYLHLAAMPADAAPGGAGSAADPRRLPAMRIDSKRFSYGATDFGALQLQAMPAAAGIRLEQLSLVSPVMRVDARGNWVQVGEEQYSSFNIDFDTNDFGRALASFGYADSIRGGKGRSTISARWGGPPTAFALARLQGSMHMEINEGRLLDVEPGAGRVFGLISLQALPRRLTLDFSDFFGKGFGFDRITGSFVVRDGIATTDDLVMVGPAARIEARGNVDLAGRRYDQTVLVVPSVGSGLPLAGAVAGGVPVGAAMLLMERVFKDDIERMTRLHYRVTGPWHEPVVERLQDGGQSGKR